jgi:hypothetical protein
LVVVVSATVLDDFYKAEKDAAVRERRLLIRRIKLDNKEAASVAENELLKAGARVCKPGSLMFLLLGPRNYQICPIGEVS